MSRVESEAECRRRDVRLRSHRVTLVMTTLTAPRWHWPVMVSSSATDAAAAAAAADDDDDDDLSG